MSIRKPVFVAAALALLVSASAPALAGPRGGYGHGNYGHGYRHHHNGRGVDFGDVLLGGLIVGGVVAIASAASKQKERERAERSYDPYYRDYHSRAVPPPVHAPHERPRYADVGSVDDAASACANAAEGIDGGRVTSIRAVSRDGAGWRVDGYVSGNRGEESFACGTRSGVVDFIQIGGSIAIR